MRKRPRCCRWSRPAAAASRGARPRKPSPPRRRRSCSPAPERSPEAISRWAPDPLAPRWRRGSRESGQARPDSRFRARALSLRFLLAEEAELLLHALIREAEENGVLFGLVAVPHPARRDENIVRSPGEALLADPGTAAPLDADEDRAGGRAVRGGLEALRQELDEGRDGRHRVIAGDRIGVFHLEAVPPAPRRPLPHRLQCRPRPRIGVAEDGRARPSAIVLDRQQVRAVARRGIALGLRRRRRLARTRCRALAEARLEELHDVNVETVEPDHGSRSGIAVVVPGPGRGDDEVDGPHGRPLAIDRGIGAFALDDEAQRRLAVAVRRRDLAGHDDLEAGKEALRDLRLALE